MNILKFILIYLTSKWYSTGSPISNHSPSGSEVDHLIMVNINFDKFIKFDSFRILKGIILVYYTFKLNIFIKFIK